jgi:predicted ATPase
VPLPVEEYIEGSFEVEPDWMEYAACPCSFTAVPGSDHAHDAERAREVLRAAGIPCHLSVVSPDPPAEATQRFDEYRALVPASLNLKAISVLDKEIFNADLEADWRAHFAELSQEELRALNPEIICAGLRDRVERLTRAYTDEIARRRPKPE